MEVKVKKILPDAVIPSKSNESDAGYDIIAIDDGAISKDGYIEYRTGLIIELPEGYHTEIFPRSSISKYNLVLANSIGLVDNGYRGELLVRFRPVHDIVYKDVVHQFSSAQKVKKYNKGDKIAQLVFRKTISFDLVEVEEVSSTARGAGGFGSTGQ